jgi:hypothetical protein
MANNAMMELEEVQAYHIDAIDGLRRLFQYFIDSRHIRFIGYTVAEVDSARDVRILETEIRSSLVALASIEAAFRVDYLTRVERRLKDALSVKLRDLHSQQGVRISFEADILEAWKDSYPELKTLIGDLKGALKYRHWLAHGRYWTPKFGRDYDYLTIDLLAIAIQNNFPLLS